MLVDQLPHRVGLLGWVAHLRSLVDMSIRLVSIYRRAGDSEQSWFPGSRGKIRFRPVQVQPDRARQSSVTEKTEGPDTIYGIGAFPLSLCSVRRRTVTRAPPARSDYFATVSFVGHHACLERRTHRVAARSKCARIDCDLGLARTLRPSPVSPPLPLDGVQLHVQTLAARCTVGNARGRT